MAQVKDPVCGMMLDSDTAAGRFTYEGATYYFCSTECLEQFERNSARYATAGAGTGQVNRSAATTAADHPAGLERHEPPFTKTDSILAPKFGSAGSGGAEYERLPEVHDRHGGGDHGTR